MELFGFTFELHHDNWLVIGSSFDLEGPQLHVLLNDGVAELSSDESLSIKDCIDWVLGDLIFGSISNQPLRFSEGHVRWSGSVTLVVGNDFNSVVLPHSDT